MKPTVLSYVNRRGDRYFLHAGLTKTGKTRYFVAKKVGPGALAVMPDGFELTESINGVVSLRRIDRNAPQLPPEHLELVRAELARHPRLRFHRVEAVAGELVVFEPFGGLDLKTEAVVRQLGVGNVDRGLDFLASRTRYTPVLKFVPDGPDTYAVHRMTYRGDGGWSWQLARGPLAKLAPRFVGVVGTDAFFETF